MKESARNAFNEDNRTAMLWAVRYKWPSGAQFTFNCYRHWDTLVVRDVGDGLGHFLHSKEGVTQREPLAMIAYGIGFLPLIWELRAPTFASHSPGMLMTRGRAGGGVPVGVGALPGSASTGTSPGLLIRADQEYLGRGPGERHTG